MTNIIINYKIIQRKTTEELADAVQAEIEMAPWEPHGTVVYAHGYYHQSLVKYAMKEKSDYDIHNLEKAILESYI